MNNPVDLQNSPEILVEALLPFFEGDGSREEKAQQLKSYIGKVSEPAILQLFGQLLTRDKVTTEQMYDAMAAFYDAAFPDREHAVEILDLLEPAEKRGIFLDLGCGTGESTKPLLDMTEIVRVIGIDFSEQMLNAARKKMANHKRVADLALLRASFLDSPPESCTNTDVLVSVGVSRHIPLGEEGKYFEFVANCLKPGGIALIAFVIHCPDPAVKAIDLAVEEWMQAKGVADRRFSEEEIETLFSGVGMKIEKTVNRPSKYLYEKYLVKAARRSAQGFAI